ncbi:SDR family NAD(P)-dependent oxidoreductase [Oceanimonas baumannii]|uniref:NAD(P)-dependent dehydrogenase (Short-subunit alcohol dehydrogenase family) n=1 Tax=Oceanimonas baumannii TaxID=129578 RepID=A0A235CF89_9GAMM|nr:SDR family oxidoreductase [Oceanimonas baumannii]OYD23288.1 short-chain dehydrogenase [Oceanimonas baumannii]TDW58568.1 NAD(P)-dependent dehydrogenase (short-subunit alcohol dehydrogenase family) [Oceanimonas baumannii]
MNRFDSQVVLVTGGASGIGRASALAFAAEGARVVVVDMNQELGEETAAQIRHQGSEAVFIEANVSKAIECQNVMQRTLETFGRLDVLFNNAGITRRADVVNTTEQEWDAVMNTNVKSIFLMCKYAVPIMRAQGGGAIVNTASGWGILAGKDAVSYCASKGAVVLLTKAMAIDHGPQKIRVNCVCPGDTDTNMLRDEALQLGQAEMALVEAGIDRPLKRVGTPEDIARAVLFLASDQASFVTGSALIVDGGGLAGSA